MALAPYNPCCSPSMTTTVTTTCCISICSAQSWYELQQAQPMNPFDLIQNATIGGTAGVSTNSNNYNNSTWAANTVGLSAAPQCSALETTNAQMTADAAQWNFSHMTSNSASTIPPPLLNHVYMRGGPQWAMTLPLSFGATTYTNLQLSLLHNAATRGDAQGTVPVIQWTGSFSGNTTLSLTLKNFGRYTLGLRCDTGSAVSMYQSDWIIVP